MKNLNELLKRLENSFLEFIDENNNQVIYAEWLNESQRPNQKDLIIQDNIN